jgi:cobalt-zinc-cadmium efflux system membrane fusion protein
MTVTLPFLGQLALALCLLIPACSRKSATQQESKENASEEGKHDDESGEHEKLPSRVRLSAKVVADAGIKTAPVALKSLPLTVDLTGEVAADPDRVAQISARVPGRVADVRYKEGDRVQAGALLAVLESADVARARADLRSTQARAQVAQQNAQRLETLARSGLAAGQEVAAARAEADALSAEAAAAQRTLLTAGAQGDNPSVARLEVRAPIAGTILSRDAVRGQTVSADHVLAVVADLDSAYFVGRLFEKNIARVHSGERAEVRLNAYPDEVFIGNVERIGNQLDPTARTVVARIAIKNRDERLKVGLFGKARVAVADATPTPPQLVVPLNAVVRIAEEPVVFVRQTDGHFEVHPVKLGRSAEGQVETLSGLRAGEEVVVEGAFTVKSVVLKGSFAEED